MSGISDKNFITDTEELMLVNTDVNIHRKKLNVPLIYDFYLCLVYLIGQLFSLYLKIRIPQLYTRLAKVSPKRYLILRALFLSSLDIFALNFIWNQKCFVCPLSRESYTIPRGHLLPVLSGRHYSATLREECTLPDPLKYGRYISRKV